MKTSVAVRPGLELSSCCVYMWLTIIEWVGPGLYSRPTLYLLKDAINHWLLNGTSFYLEEASIRGNMVFITKLNSVAAVTFYISDTNISFMWIKCSCAMHNGMVVPVRYSAPSEDT